jgi:hypothetical protein
MVKAVVTVCAAAALVGVLAGTASAGRRPPVNPAIAQYIEVLPTSGGAAVPAGRGRTQLPKHVAAELKSTPQDKLLRAVATSAAYGAPQHEPRAKKHAAVKVRDAATKPKSSVEVSRSAFGASVNAVGTDRSVVVWLGLALLGIAAAGAGAAAFGRRRHGR